MDLPGFFILMSSLTTFPVACQMRTSDKLNLAKLGDLWLLFKTASDVVCSVVTRDSPERKDHHLE